MNRVILDRIAPRVPARMLAAGLVLTLLAASTVPARAGGRIVAPPPPEPPVGIVPMLAGDETIGILPILAPAPVFNLVDYFYETNACLYVQGQRFDVMTTVVGSIGSAVATLEVLDAATDTVRVVFHGRAQLKLDRQFIDLGLVDVGIVAPLGFGSGVIKSSFHDRVLPEQNLTPGASAFSPALISATRAYQGRIAHLVAAGQTDGFTSFALRSTRRFLFVAQAHD
jgi:hypothetical protein